MRQRRYINNNAPVRPSLLMREAYYRGRWEALRMEMGQKKIAVYDVGSYFSLIIFRPVEDSQSFIASL